MRRTLAIKPMRLNIRQSFAVAAVLVPIAVAFAEYGDVILNNRAESANVAPVIFPHWFHRIRFQCSVCHQELEIKMEVGANDITMDMITAGEHCGACHNGEVAWAADNCNLCHSGKAGLKTGIQGGHETAGPGRW